jgi:hypothetical protein
MHLEGQHALICRSISQMRSPMGCALHATDTHQEANSLLIRGQETHVTKVRYKEERDGSRCLLNTNTYYTRVATRGGSPCLISGNTYTSMAARRTGGIHLQYVLWMGGVGVARRALIFKARTQLVAQHSNPRVVLCKARWLNTHCLMLLKTGIAIRIVEYRWLKATLQQRHLNVKTARARKVVMRAV